MSSERGGLRLLLMTETFAPEVGGGETQAALLANCLARRGNEVTVLTRRSQRDSPAEEQIGQVRVVRVPPCGRGRLRKWALLGTTPVALLRARDHIDLIFVSGFRVLGVPAVLAARMFDKPCVLKADSRGEMSGEFFRAGLAQSHFGLDSATVQALLKMRNALLRRASGFVAISAELRDELVRHGVPASQIQCIPNGVDLVKFCPPTSAEKRALRQRLSLGSGKIVVYTGRLVSYKGLPLLLRAWREVCGTVANATLVLVGGQSNDMHDCEAELRSFVAESGMSGSVIFTGTVKNVHSWLRAADLFVFPTQNEAFGLSLVEAMACGLPAVTTRVGGIRDFVVDGRNAEVVDAGHFQQLRDALESLLTNSDRATALGKEAHATATRRFGEEAVADAYESYFRSILHHDGRLRAA